ncbi:MAG: hypothetical protein MJ249_04965 [Kiritimatiellae bacterium]|nr:hypothetical protein [Kiritimatiellia bacterium]
MKLKVVKTLAACVAGMLGLVLRAEVPLPSTYLPVDYIEADGSQYLDPGVKAKTNTSVDITFGNIQNVNNSTIFGTTIWGGNVYLFIVQNNVMRIYGNTNIVISEPLGGTETYRLNWAANNDYTFYKDGTVVKSGSTARTGENGNNSLWFFKGNTGSAQYAKMRLYALKIGEGNTLLRDYVPCWSPEGVPGLWDKVGGKFYASATSTPFRAPWPKTDGTLPGGYTPIAYIKSTGTQTINTGFTVTGNTVADVSCGQLTREQPVALFGTGWGGSAYLIALQSDVVQFWGTSTKVADIPVPDRDFRIQIASDGVTVTLAGGEPQKTTLTHSANANLWLFGCGQTDHRSKYALYGMKLWTSAGGALERDFVPCRNKVNEAGLFDRVHGKFYGSATGDKFIGPYGDSRLPSGYVPVEYIESTGNAWIDAGTNATQNTRIEASFNTCTLSQAWGVFFGTAGGDRSSDGVLLRYYNNTLNLNGFFCNAIYDEAQIGVSANTDVQVVLEKNKMTVNGTEGTITTSASPYAGNIYLFCGNNVGTAWRHQTMRLYSFKMSENGVPVRDFVPCRNLNGEAGLWDKVEGKFYGNCGPGAFTTPAGILPREVTLPEGYTKLNWIGSSGTQYIDTQYVPQAATQVTAFFKPLARNENWAAFFSSLNNDSSQNAVSLRYYNNTCTINGMFCNAAYGEATTSGTYEEAFVAAALRRGVMIIDGVRSGISTTAEPYQGSLILFGERNGSQIRRQQAMRLFSLTISENGTVVHDYVPCRRNSDGLRGLYDLVAQEFKTNDGTGIFAGSDVAVYAKLDGDGYAYYGAEHERVGAPTTGITGLPLAFANDAEFQALVAVPERVAQAAGVILERNITLSEDVDWSGFDFDFAGNTINLAGHNLTVASLNGEGLVTDATGYLLLDYIKSTGTQTINTGITATSSLVADVFCGQVTHDQPVALFGTGWGGNAYLIAVQGGIVQFWGNGMQAYPSFIDCDFRVQINEMGAIITTADGERKTAALNHSANGNLWIFGCGQTDHRSKYALYSMTLQASANGAIVRDFVPAKRLSDGKIGLLDRAHFGENATAGVPEFYVDANGGNFVAGAVTNVLHCGELHVNVAADKTAENTSVVLDKAVRLVKGGAGTFVATKANQTYEAGTVVNAGTVRLGSGTCFGPAKTEVVVDAEATLEMAGVFDIADYAFVFAGGTLQNTVADIGNNKAQLTRIFLAADTAMPLAKSAGFIGSGYAATTLDLAGRTLAVDVAAGKSFWLYNADVTAGTLALTGAGTCEIDKTGLRAAATDFDLGCGAVTVAVNGEVHNWTVGAATAVSGNGVITIRGTYRPVGDAISHYVLANGATLDLSAKDSTFDVTGKDIAFTDNSTIIVDFGTRTFSDEEKLVAWAAKPAGVLFKLKDGLVGGLEAREDGLYVISAAAVEFAEWTGLGTADDLQDPRNWRCTSFAGQAVANGLPANYSTIVLTAGCTFSCPAENPLACAAVVLPPSLGADCDWRGLQADVVSCTGPINLCGHKLYVSSLEGMEAVTDTVGAGYRLLDYIQSTGSQVIKTGLKPSGNTTSDITLSHLQNVGNSVMFGNGDWGPSAYMFMLQGSELKIWGQSTIRISGQPLGGSDTYRLTWGEGDVYTFYKNGASVATGTSGRTPARSMELWVFKANTGSAQYAKMRLYSLKLGEGATIRRDYVPAQRISDGKTGLLDLAHFGKATASDPEFYPDANGGEFTIGSVTNYLYTGAERGELHLDVPAGSIVNADVAFTGSLKFVKEGEGTFRARKQGQTYFGGTEVKGGLLEFDNVKSASGSYGTYTADRQLLGAGGSTLTIDEGAKVNVAGTFGLRFYNFALNGGTLENDSLDGQALLIDNSSSSPNPGFGVVTLAADSTLLALRQFVFENGRLDLGGNTLTIDFSGYGNKYVFLRGGQTCVNGTICVKGGSPSQFGQIYVDAADLDMRTVNFDMAQAEFNLAKSLSVKDYIARAPLGTGTADNTGKGALNVYGTFKTFNAFFYGCTLQDGATLDLSAQTGAWSTTSTGTCPTKTVTFAKDAVITIDLGSRADAGDKGKIVAWTEKPADIDTVTFNPSKNTKGRIEVCDDGIYLRRGLTLFLR